MASQDELLAMLQQGAFGPWAGQGFVPGGITFLDPGTWQWVTVVGTPGSADYEMTVNPIPVDPGELEEAPVPGLPVTGGIGLPPGIAGGGARPGLLSAISPGSYGDADFPRTALGEIRLTVGQSNGVSGPLSPIVMAQTQQVDQNGNKWLPEVRMFNTPRSTTGSQGGGGSW